MSWIYKKEPSHPHVCSMCEKRVSHVGCDRKGSKSKNRRFMENDYDIEVKYLGLEKLRNHKDILRLLLELEELFNGAP